MPDAWTLLTDNSLIGSGDAWTHLNNQGGNFEGVATILHDGLEIEMCECDFDVEVEVAQLSVEIAPIELEVEIDNANYEVEICDG